MNNKNWYTLGGASESLERPPKYILPDNVTMTPKLIKAYIDDYKKYIQRFYVLQDYYEGWAEINNREDKKNKANNRIVNPYPKYITDVLTGMFVGDPVRWTASDDEQAAMEVIQECYNLNDEQDENMELAKMCSIKGVGYEIVYLDDDLDIRFNELNPQEIVYIWDDKINPEPLHAIRFIETPDPQDPLENTVMQVMHFTRNEVITYIDSGEGLQELENSRTSHLFGQVPIIQYNNNDEQQGDFEQVISLINAYNKVASDDMNYIEEFVDGLLILSGMTQADDLEIRRMWEDGAILLGENQTADWLSKDINAKTVENTKTRLDNDIHKFAFVPNLTDEKFAGNVSGEAMKYKLLGIRQILATKERKFKRALQRRLELIIAGMKNIAKATEKGALNIEYTDINLTFKPNLPINELENVQMVKELLTFTSKQHALSKLHGLDDPSEEIQAIEEESDRFISLDEAKELLRNDVLEDEQD